MRAIFAVFRACIKRDWSGSLPSDEQNNANAWIELIGRKGKNGERSESERENNLAGAESFLRPSSNLSPFFVFSKNQTLLLDLERFS